MIENRERRPVSPGDDPYGAGYAHGREQGFWRGFSVGALVALFGSLAWALLQAPA